MKASYLSQGGNEHLKFSVKPLTHWAIYKGYRMRYTSRTPEVVAGILTTLAGATLPFVYDTAAQRVELPHEHIIIDEHGWEVERVTL